jgi:hypothetical protein
VTAQVQQTGLANITAALVTASVVKFLQWGTGTGAVSSATTVTTTSTTEARTSGTMSQQTTTTTNDTLQVVGTITALGARAITEVGVFDAVGSGGPATGGNMDIYGSFAVVNLLTGDSIAFTVKVTWT